MASGFDETPVADAREVLAGFLIELRGFLPTTLDNQAAWVPAELTDPLWRAWREVEPNFDTAVLYLREPPDIEVLERQLSDVGLRDDQLALKETGFRNALGRFRDRLTKPALKSVLGWANIILGSLAGIIPGGDAIEEYKEGHEQALEDGDLDDGGDDDAGGQPSGSGPSVRGCADRRLRGGPDSRPAGFRERPAPLSGRGPHSQRAYFSRHSPHTTRCGERCLTFGQISWR